MKIVFKLVFLINTQLISNCIRAVQPIDFRSSLYRLRPGHRLDSNMISSTTAASELSCAHKCLGHDGCQSCNFGVGQENRGTCELNSRGLMSQTHDPALIDDGEFIFISPETVRFWLIMMK